jgi:hypothetical protein
MLIDGKVKVHLNKHDRQGNVIGRRTVTARLLKENKLTILVQLPSGKVIVRKKNRDVEDAQ